MAKINRVLTERLKTESPAKISYLAEKSSSGALTSFAAIFGNQTLSAEEKQELSDLLMRFNDQENINTFDLDTLSQITLELKAINHQAALLHGERIKRVQQLLKNYQEGAFSAWLMKIYGNRQTPYNFLNYYECFQELSKELHPIMEKLPRQIIYSLASREGSREQKEALIKEAMGKNRQALLEEIRSRFPLGREDKRSHSSYLTLLTLLEKAMPLATTSSMDKQQQESVLILLKNLQSRVLTK